MAKKRVRKSELHLSPYIKKGSKFRVGVSCSGISPIQAEQAGFSSPIKTGEAVLLSPLLGKISDFNANGKNGAPKKGLPKEKFIVEYSTDVKDWHGNYHHVMVSQHRERYQRDKIQGPNEELFVFKNTKGDQQIVSKEMIFGANPQLEVHIINLLLEAFGDFSVYDSNANCIISAPITRVGWKLLPAGNWSTIKKNIISIINKTRPNYTKVLEGRLEFLNGFSPATIAVGVGGFGDYLAFEFPAKGLCVLESIRPLNATYVFQKKWQVFSQLTKQQIISQGLAKNRLLHTESWEQQISKLLK